MTTISTSSVIFLSRVLPNEGYGRYTICDKRGNHCFKKRMNDVNLSKETCPPSCEQIRFITSEIHKKIDPIKECEKGDVPESFMANYIHMNLNSMPRPPCAVIKIVQKIEIGPFYGDFASIM